MISVNHISKSFGKNIAVKDISFNIKEGENFILLGTSGCGKTTTLKMINRLIVASSGTILIRNKNINDIQPEKLRRDIGYVLQRNSLFPHYTVSENIAVVPRLLKWDKRKTEIKSASLLSKFHLSEQRLSAYPNELSGGEAQRVNLARALIADPSILLMDEPFGALDTITRTAIRKEFSTLEEFRKKTVLMVTHDVQEAFELADRICLMDKGEIMQVGTAKELLFQPANDFVKRFFADMYFQSSLSVTKLKDIWPYIKVCETPEHIRPMLFTADTDLWTVIKEMTENRQDKPFINIQQQTQDKFADLEDIMNAFSHYKNNL